ncbi:tol-pal system protein YbgF [Desulfocurvus sp.]|uniref:tol-pal system protein YbgF n=1 Tax=Desulfocurvus sp. TaxID=2871698 RepID=UPI0025C5964A|nr:tol-pal system protein YbgF [Desulfocurvus sp.]MCK9241323.1 tol-pal system protein YbgF [Desulfocurvus sp.]
MKDVTLGEPMGLRGGVAQPGMEMQAPASPATDETTVAALPETANPEELYGNSYEFILSGDYATAEAGFRRHVEQFPADPRTADARYWLGETYYHEGDDAQAIVAFKAVYQQYPRHPKAAAALLKIGYAYQRLGDAANARFYLQALVQDHPDSEPAALARKRLESLR